MSNVVDLEDLNNYEFELVLEALKPAFAKLQQRYTEEKVAVRKQHQQWIDRYNAERDTCSKFRQTLEFIAKTSTEPDTAARARAALAWAGPKPKEEE